MDPDVYKAYHVDAMSNNKGTTPEDTLLCIFFSILSVSLCVIGRGQRSQHFQLLNEFFFISLLMVFTYTLLFTYITEITKCLIGAMYFLCIYHLDRSSSFKAFKNPNTFSYQRMDCVTNFRGLIYILTVFCILAVDFTAFPRVHSKTEKYGFSLMDTGVGLFTMGSGLVHKTYVNTRTYQILKDNYKLLCIVMVGFLRTILVKAVDYHEHVTEYGLHWNFFYTLAIVKITSLFLLQLVPRNRILLVSALTLTLHQCCLNFGIEEWVHSDIPRDTFLNASREGISSCLGYLSLYLFAFYIKSVLTDRSRSRRVVLAKLCFYCFISFIVIFNTSYVFNVSRVLANAGYCVFMVLVFMVTMIMFYSLEVVLYECRTSSVPVIIEAFNKNGLFLFVLANVLTGIINIYFQTLLVKPWMSVCILNIYITFLTWVAIFLQRKNIVVL